MRKWAGGYFHTKNVQFENVNFFIKFSRAETLPDSAEDFLIFRENKPIWAHKFDNLPDSGIFCPLNYMWYKQIFLIGEENLPDCKMLMLAAE